MARSDAKGPELYALHPADHRLIVERLDLTRNHNGGYSQRNETFGAVGASFVPDHHVRRGTLEAWESAIDYRRFYEERDRRLGRPRN
jgi:hypothetical protein